MDPQYNRTAQRMEGLTERIVQGDFDQDFIKSNYRIAATAVEINDLSMLRFLLENGACLANDQTTALHKAIISGKLACAKLLFERRSELRSARDAEGRTPLHLAAKCKMMHILKLFEGANTPMDIKDNRGRNVVHYAAESRDIKILEYALQRFPQLIDSEDSRRTTPLSVCIRGKWWAGAQRIMDVISPGLKHTTEDPYMESSASENESCEDEGTQTTPLLWTEQDSQSNCSPERHLCEFDNHLGQRLISTPSDATSSAHSFQREEENFDAFEELVFAVRQGDFELTKRLVIYVDLMDAVDDDGEHILFHGARSDDLSILSLLYKAEPRLVFRLNSEGESVLHLLAREHSYPMLDALRDCGADMCIMNSAGDTVLTDALREGQVDAAIKLGRRFRALWTHRCPGGYGPTHVAAEIDLLKYFQRLRFLFTSSEHPKRVHGLDLDEVDDFGRTPLLIAAAYGARYVLDFLISDSERGGPPNGLQIAHCDRDGNTAGHLCLMHKHTTCFLSLAEGAHIDYKARNAINLTVIDLLISSRQVGIMIALLQQVKIDGCQNQEDSQISTSPSSGSERSGCIPPQGKVRRVVSRRQFEVFVPLIYYAASVDEAGILLEAFAAGAELFDLLYRGKRSLTQIAFQTNSVGFVKAMLSRDRSFTRKLDLVTHKYPYQMAESLKRSEIFQLLANFGATSIDSSINLLALKDAIRTERIQNLEALCSSGTPEDITTAFKYAIELRTKPCIEWFIRRRGPALLPTTSDAYEALVMVVNSGNFPLIQWILRKKPPFKRDQFETLIGLCRSQSKMAIRQLLVASRDSMRGRIRANLLVS